MAGFSMHPTPPAKPFKPAWMLSVVLHVAVIVALCVEIQPSRRGTTDAQAGSIGIVLNGSATEDAQNEFGQFKVQQALAVDDDLTPPVLLAANTTEATDSATNKNSDDSSKSTQPSSNTSAATAKSGAKQDKKSEKKGARPKTAIGHIGSSVSNNYAQVSVFGVQGRGSKFIYVFDRSASMNGPPLAAAKKQLLESLKSLDSVHQFHIMFFNTKTQSFDLSGGGRRIAFATDRNKKLAENFVGGITADGGTDRTLALLEAINLAPDVSFFLTDADDPMPLREMAQIARANRKIQATICVIEFGTKPAPAPNNFLSRLAHDNGGQYGYVDTTKLH
jgi:hypothetical protein